MYLHRTTYNPFADYDYAPGGQFAGLVRKNYRALRPYSNSEWYVATDFDRFGAGTKRQSDFQVGVSWEDVENIITKFCEIGHQEAIAVREARKLAAAVKQLGWQEPGGSTQGAQAA